MSAMQGLSAARAATVRAIPLEQAVQELRHLATRCEIRHSNLVLRVLHELDGAAPGPAGPVPSSFRLVEPLGHHGYRRHVADERQGGRVTMCGVDCGSWRESGRITLSAARSSDGVCRRCRRSVELAYVSS